MLSGNGVAYASGNQIDPDDDDCVDACDDDFGDCSDCWDGIDHLLDPLHRRLLPLCVLCEDHLRHH